MIGHCEIHSVQTPAGVVVECRGSLDYTDSRRLQSILDEAAASGEAVSVDFCQTESIDSAIVGCLVKTAVQSEQSDLRLKVLVQEKTHPLRVLSLLGLNAIMDIEMCSGEEQ